MRNELDLSKLKHMDIVDMPSDPNGYLGGFRSSLRGAYNSNRCNESAITLIRDTLEYAVGVLRAAEKTAPAPLLLSAPEVPPAPEKQASKTTNATKLSNRAAKR